MVLTYTYMDGAGGSTLTDEELACIRKYTAVLLKPDLYERLEDEVPALASDLI